MSNALDERLELMLRGLAEQAPAGPSAARVMARLARRRLVRWLQALCAVTLICGIGGGGAWYAGTFSSSAASVAPKSTQLEREPAHVLPSAPPSDSPATEPTQEPGEVAPQIVKPRVAPLAPDADHLEMHQVLRDFFANCGAERAIVMKDGDGQLSFSMGLQNQDTLAQIRADLESLLFHYDRAEINLRNGRLSYSLLASGRP
jgi:hypothetical protein